MKRRILLLILLAAVKSVCAQNADWVLEGKIGKYPVIMEISILDSTSFIRYFYLDQRNDVHLEGSVDKKGNIKASTPEQFLRADIPGERFILSKTSQGYAGHWIQGLKRFAVQLKKAHAASYKSVYVKLAGIEELRKNNLYNYIKLSGFRFVTDTKSKHGKLILEWPRETYSGVRVPRVKSGYSDSAMDRMNRNLLEFHLTASLQSLECSSGPWGEYDLAVSDFYAGPHVLSMVVRTSYYCGGAHPDFSTAGLNFDAVSGKILLLDKLFWFGGNKPVKGQKIDSGNYHAKVFTPEIVKIFRSLYPEHMATPGENEENACDYTDEQVWTFPSWYFTEKGLHLGANFARVARSCDDPEWAVIPYSILKPYLRPDSPIQLPE